MITQLLQLCECAKDRAFALHALELLHPLHKILNGLLIHRALFSRQVDVDLHFQLIR
ncbi:hypothetical protein D3C85_1720840 [compost metagenome]